MKTFIFQVYNGDFTQEVHVIMKKKLITHANYYINKRFFFFINYTDILKLSMYLFMRIMKRVLKNAPASGFVPIKTSRSKLQSTLSA